MIVRQSTAFETAIGPVLDGDGVAVTDCVVGDFKLKKTSGNFAALNASATLTHVSAGVYDLVLTTSDTDTVGVSAVAIDDTVNACPILYLQIVEEAIFDALFAASANGFAGAAGSSTVTFSNTSIATVTNLTNLPTIPANWLTAAGTAADFGTEIGTAVWATVARTVTAATNITSTGAAVPITGDGHVSAQLANVAHGGGSASLTVDAINVGTNINVTEDVIISGTFSANVITTPLISATNNNISWNSAWDAEVQSEAADAITAASLPTAVQVWAAGTRTLTAGTNIQLPSNGLANVTAWTVAITGNITGNLSGSVGSVTGNVNLNLSQDNSSPLVSSVVGGQIQLIEGRADQASVNDLPTNAELATALAAVWTTALTEAYRATGATGTGAQLLYEILQNLTEFSNSGTTRTVKKLDGSTTAKTYTYDDADTPTSCTETT